MESKYTKTRNKILRLNRYIEVSEPRSCERRTTFSIESHTWTCEKVGAETYENKVARSWRRHYISRLLTTVSDYKHPRNKRWTITCTEPLPFSYCHSCHHLKQLSSPELNLPTTHSKIQTHVPCRYRIRAPFECNKFNMYADSSATGFQHLASCISPIRKWQILIQKSNYASSTVLLTGESLMNDCKAETSIKLFKNRDACRVSMSIRARRMPRYELTTAHNVFTPPTQPHYDHCLPNSSTKCAPGYLE